MVLPINNAPVVQPPVNANNNAPVVTPPVVTPPVVTPPADPVDVALAALNRCDNVETLWQTKVVNVKNLVKRFFGLITYAWNKSAALKLDKAAIDFKNATSELVTAVARRPYTLDEARNVPPIQLSNHLEQLNYANQLALADQKLSEFYAAFKARVTQLTSDSADFGKYALAARKAIDSLSQSKEVTSRLLMPLTIPTKIQTTLEAFNGKVFVDMVDTYANKPIAEITVNSYKAEVALIKSVFSSISLVDIEALLRQAIKQKHDEDELDTVAGDFADQNVDNPKVTAIKDAMVAPFTAEKTVLENKLNELCGTNGFNGTIHSATVRKETAETALNQAVAAAQVALLEPARSAEGAQASQLVILLTGLADPRYATLRATLEAAVIELTAANQALNDLNSSLRAIAQFNENGQIVGGRLLEINQNIDAAALNLAARNEANKIASFYSELNIAVVEDNKVDCRTALRQIIGN